ncbi:MAG: class F sortase [Dehalococcoidia bacterium]
MMLESLLADRRRQLIAGAIALVVLLSTGGVAFALFGGGSDEPPARVEDVRIATSTATPTPTRTPTPTPTPSPTPEPTPPPYDGAIVRLSAPRLGIDHYIEQVYVVNNEMQEPSDGVYAVGWYPEYSKPGFGENAVFSAHETWNRSRGPFYSLHLAVPGDEIIVTMDNGIEYRYEVMTNIRYDVNSIPMGEVIWPSTRPEGEEWITLITCGGRIVYNETGYGDYLDRDVVQARRVDNITAASATNASTGAAASNR